MPLTKVGREERVHAIQGNEQITKYPWEEGKKKRGAADIS